MTMSVYVGNELETTLRAIGRAWAWILAFGIISIVAGLAAIFLPGPTLVAIAIVFAVQLVVGAVFRFIGAFAIPGEAGWLRALQAILAILSFVIGVYLFGHIALTIVALALLLGLYWMVHGVVELFLAIGHPELPGRTWMIVSGILGLVAGAVVIVAPGISLFFLTVVLGVWLVLFGAFLALQAFHVRAATHRVGSPRPAGT
jgi:uncharacterized membrane protein HdeD (DUF308 family)